MSQFYCREDELRKLNKRCIFRLRRVLPQLSVCGTWTDKFCSQKILSTATKHSTLYHF